jgi:hypothetical protein
MISSEPLQISLTTRRNLFLNSRIGILHSARRVLQRLRRCCLELYRNFPCWSESLKVTPGSAETLFLNFRKATVLEIQSRLINSEYLKRDRSQEVSEKGQVAQERTARRTRPAQQKKCAAGVPARTR